MARRKAAALPDPGAPPEELLRFGEDEWADDRQDAAFMPGGEFAHAGLLRFRRKSRWRAAQRAWSAENGLDRYYLLRRAAGQRGEAGT